MTTDAARIRGNARPAPPLAPGRYCLATCYCGQCDHYKPLPTPRAGVAPVIDKRINKTWTEREVTTWIDDM